MDLLYIDNNFYSSSPSTNQCTLSTLRTHLTPCVRLLLEFLLNSRIYAASYMNLNCQQQFDNKFNR